MGRVIFIFLILGFLVCSSIYASPIYLPSALKELDEGREEFREEKFGEEVVKIEKGGVSFSFVFDSVGQRKLKREYVENFKFKAQVIGGKIAYTLDDRFDIYATFGEFNDIEYKGIVFGDNYKLEFKDDTIWGVGLNGIIYSGMGIEIFGDGNYRRARKLKAKALTINGVRYTQADVDFTVDVEGEYEEWQAALGAGKKLRYFVPYAGVKYSNVETSAKVTALGKTYDTDNVKSKKEIGFFTGVSVMSSEILSIDFCGRFVDEKSFSAIATLRF